MPHPAPGIQQPILMMAGDVDVATEQEWRLRGEQLLTANPELRDFTVDLSEVGFLDSRGMAVLITFYNQATQRGGVLSLRAVPPRVARALHVAGLDQVFVLDLQ